MLISHRYRFIYFKTIKTAGTSVEVALEPLCQPEDMPMRDNRRPGGAGEELVTEAGIIGFRGPPARSGDATWLNHMTAAEIRANLPAEIWESYTKFCNIRNPWDKTVSWFHFRFPEMKSRPAEEIHAAFRTWLAGRPKVGKDISIYMIDGEPVMDDYVRYDTMDEDLARIGGRLGFGLGALPRLKSAPRGRQKLPYQGYYDEVSREAVARIYARPIELFGWSFA